MVDLSASEVKDLLNLETGGNNPVASLQILKEHIDQIIGELESSLTGILQQSTSFPTVRGLSLLSILVLIVSAIIALLRAFFVA